MKLDKIQNLIINWVKKYSKQSNTKHLIIGISGGIDSALTSTLCAMCGIKTIILSMPIHQNQNQLDNANQHGKWIAEQYPNTEFLTIELTDLFEKYKNSIPEKYHSDLSLANTRARLRMTTLYQIASKQNGLVVGTGNKIEDFGIGFFTELSTSWRCRFSAPSVSNSAINFWQALSSSIGVAADIKTVSGVLCSLYGDV